MDNREFILDGKKLSEHYSANLVSVLQHNYLKISLAEGERDFDTSLKLEAVNIHIWEEVSYRLKLLGRFAERMSSIRDRLGAD